MEQVVKMEKLFHTVSPDLIICFIQRAGLFYVI